MQMDMACKEELKKLGASEDMIAQYQRHLDSGDKQGQKRLLCRFRKMQSEALKKNRERLTCLDYIIARVEKTQALGENGQSSEKI